ncbi:MAG TPA: hypothetical protein VGG64_18855 [Pirellulales bacterium]|jgi:hypothetical protein
MNSQGQHNAHGDEVGESIVMPVPTAAPLVLSLGATLLAAGIVTNLVLSALGAVVLLWGVAVWVLQLLPGRGEHEHALVAMEMRPQPIAKAIIAVAPRPTSFIRRMQVPAQIHPYSSSVWGGIVGGIAMSGVALAYGVVSGRGIWYPVNLLAAMLMPAFATADNAELERFDGTALALGLVIHGMVSAGAGLIYGMLLPTLPRWPALWGGIVAPLLWTGGVYSFMGVLNPVMNARVDWPWFVASQVVYGLTAGFVVVHSKTVSVGQTGRGSGNETGSPPR